MEKSYTDYLNNSTCYKNLFDAIEKLTTIKKNIDILQGAFLTASGNNIDEIKIDLKKIETFLEEFITKTSNNREKLQENAKLFDAELKKWQGKIGQVLQITYYNANGGVVSPIYSVSQLLSTSSFVFKKGTTTISKVEISEKGYIKVYETEKITTYSSRVAGSVASICNRGAVIGNTSRDVIKEYNFLGSVIS